ncbi:MAG: hypothetical protein IJ131_08285, partial [Eggerthellaceae bacterium]|nr:hypothetical protein [Eggerthellaceae bacterium]
VVESWVSDGSAKTVELAPGVYTLVEESAPKGYLIAESITFMVGEDGTVKIRQADGSYVDAADSTVVMVDGVDETPEPGPEPTPEPGPDPDPTPDPTPEPGPDPTPGPSPDPEPDPDPAPTPDPISDKPEPKPGNDPVVDPVPVNFSKTDVAGEELPGATIRIVSGESAGGTVVESWVSDGSAKTVELAPGVYTLVEESAPKGYLIAESITFTVSADGTVKIRQADGSYVDAADSTVVMVDGVDETPDQPKQDPVPHVPVDNPSSDTPGAEEPGTDKPDGETPSKDDPDAPQKDTPIVDPSNPDDPAGDNGEEGDQASSSTPLPTPNTPAAPSTSSTPSTPSSAGTTAAKTSDSAPVGIVVALLGCAGAAAFLARREMRKDEQAHSGKHAGR